MDATPLASLPTECLVSILLQGSLEALGRTARTCADCRSAALDVGLWRVLLSTVWLADAGAEAAVAAGHCVLPTTATATPRAEFLRRFRLHSRLHQMRLGQGDYLTMGTFLTVLPAAPSLTREAAPTTPYPSLTAAERSLTMSKGVAMQEIAYSGRAEDVEENNTVGIACLQIDECQHSTGPLECCNTGPLECWPVGRGGQVQYFEVNILDGGSHQYIAIGWCREGYPEQCKQPGWEKHTYGYHGDDGRAYAGSGFGKRYGPSFGKVAGTVVGTGLLWSADGKSCAIFYTLDGVSLGTAFESVPRPGKLRPCVGLHSPGETVRLNFGLGPTELTRRSPPTPPTPFAFDLNGFLASLDIMRTASLKASHAVRMMFSDAAVASRNEGGGGVEGGGGGGGGDGGEGEEEEEEEGGEMLVVGDNSLEGGEILVGDDSSEEDLDSSDLDSSEGEDSLIEIRKLVASEDDISEEDLEELRYYLRSRGLGDMQIDISWGAEDIAGLPADQLRALCAQVLLEEEEF